MIVAMIVVAMAKRCEHQSDDLYVDVAVSEGRCAVTEKHKLGQNEFPMFDKSIDRMNFG